MWERTSSGMTQVVCNGVRLNQKAHGLVSGAVGVVVNTSGASTGGVFIHHGDWAGRSLPVTSEVREVFESTSLDNYFPLGEVPSGSSGPLSDLSKRHMKVHSERLSTTLSPAALRDAWSWRPNTRIRQTARLVVTRKPVPGPLRGARGCQ